MEIEKIWSNDMKLEITRNTKIASLITIIGILIAHSIYPGLVAIVPLGMLVILTCLWPGTEKVGIDGTGKYLQTMFAVALVGAIGIVLMVLL